MCYFIKRIQKCIKLFFNPYLPTYKEVAIWYTEYINNITIVYLLINSNKKMKKKSLFILACVLLSLAIPLFLQRPLNILFRDWFNPKEWIILQPKYRVWSMVTCMCFSYFMTLSFLLKAKVSVRVYILHFICCNLWAMLVAFTCYVIATD